jgi:hypothetical protein
VSPPLPKACGDRLAAPYRTSALHPPALSAAWAIESRKWCKSPGSCGPGR